jgi:hypothetical protein
MQFLNKGQKGDSALKCIVSQSVMGAVPSLSPLFEGTLHAFNPCVTSKTSYVLIMSKSIWYMFENDVTQRRGNRIAFIIALVIITILIIAMLLI